MRLHKRGEGHRGAVLAAAVLGTALAYMSDDMLNLAIPSVAQDLHASATGVQWILNAYDIPLVAFVLIAGSLGHVVGHRRMFTGGLLLFGSGAALCATAPDVGLLIAGRTLQGVAAAMLLAAGLALVTIANNPTHPETASTCVRPVSGRRHHASDPRRQFGPRASKRGGRNVAGACVPLSHRSVPPGTDYPSDHRVAANDGRADAAGA